MSKSPGEAASIALWMLSEARMCLRWFAADRDGHGVD